MKKSRIILAISVIAVLFFTSCENKVEKKLVGNWRLVSMETTGFVVSGQQLNNPVLSMAKDKTYSIFMDGKLTNGKWKANANDFYLIANETKEDEETALQIDSLTDNTLIYHNKNGKADVKVYYTKMINEEEGEEGEEHGHE